MARTLKSLVFYVVKLNDVKHLESNLMKRMVLIANVRQTVWELEFFPLQLEQDLIIIREGLDVTSTDRQGFYHRTTCHKYFRK